MNRLVLAAPLAGLLLAAPALAQNKAEPQPTPPPASTVPVAVGDQTYNLDPTCAIQAAIVGRNNIFNGGAIDTLQPFFRTSSGFLPGLIFQTADVGLEKFAVGDVPCLGRGQ